MSWVNAVSPGWFDTYGVRLSAGRDFDERRSAVARRRWRSSIAHSQRDSSTAQNPVGRQFATREPRSGVTVYEIVGLTEDALYDSLRAEMSPTMYMPLGPVREPAADITLARPRCRRQAIESRAQPGRRARTRRLHTRR